MTDLGVAHQSQKPETKFQEFYSAVVVYTLVKNYVNIRIKESHTDIHFFHNRNCTQVAVKVSKLAL